MEANPDKIEIDFEIMKDPTLRDLGEYASSCLNDDPEDKVGGLGTRAEANLSILLEGIFNGEDTQLGRNNSVEKSPFKNRPFTCLVCDKNFNNCTNWKTHLKIHSEEQLFKCLHCPNSSTSTPEKRLPFQFTQLKTQIVNVVKKGAQKIKV